MRAVYFEEHGDVSVLRYGSVPDPVPPPGWVKVRVRATSLNHSDIFARRGMPGIKVQLPGINGSDCAGEIAELGAGVIGWHVGERVLPFRTRSTGSAARSTCWARTATGRLPSSVSYARASSSASRLA